MAKGTDSEEFVMLSGPRSGLKREFAFALKAQSQLSGSLGRTRARQFQNSPSSNGALKNSNFKRLKRSDTEDESKHDFEKSPPEKELQNDSVKSPSADEYQNEAVKSPSVEERNSDLEKPSDREIQSVLLKFISACEPQNNLVKSPSEEEPQKDLEKLMTEEEPLKRCTRSALGSKAEPLLMATIIKEQSALVSKKEPNKNGSKSPREEGISMHTPIVIDDNSVVINVSAEKPLKRFTRSTSKIKAEPSVIDEKCKVHNSFPEKPLMQYTRSNLKPRVVSMMVDGNIEVQNASLEKPLVPLTVSDLELKVGSLVMDDNCRVQDAPIEEPKNNEAKSPEKEGIGLETSIGIYDNSEVHNVSTEKPPRRFTRSALKSKAELMVTDGNGEVQNALLQKSLRRFTRSSLESKIDNVEVQGASSEKSLRQFSCSALELKAESLVAGISDEVHNALSDEPLRRFTRSALKPKAESIEISVMDKQRDSSVASKDACKNEAIARDDGRMNDVASPTMKRLGIKESKKITLTKFPSKVKELLETGMLEGLPVKYIFQGKKSGELRGMIKDNGILCFCTLCNGYNVITPMQFERHAGSTNRRPGCYIFLENGNNLAKVLDACKNSPLAVLEATIRSAIGSSLVKIDSICLNCKRPLPSSRTRRRTIQLCNSCRKLKKSRECSAHTVGSDARLLKPILTPKSLDSVSKCISPQNKSGQGKLTRKDLRLHKLVFEEDYLPDGTELAYYVCGQKLLEGYKKGFGIFCRCCSSEISPSQFEAHAGWASRRKPYLHIYTSNGVSLHELAISISKGRRFSAKDNDDLCGICADFGNLLLCDGCPRAFHKDCVGQSNIPRGDWYCPYCQNMFEREKFAASSVNAKAAGRVSGVDPIEQISKRCIRIVKTPETEIGGCTLCRCPGFSKSGFGPRTIIFCDQCEREYHVGCLKDHKMGNLKELPKGQWFCCANCSRIHSALQKLIVRGSERLPDSLSNVIKKKLQENCANSNADFDIRWRLLSGKITSPESRSLLSKAVAIFHNCFDPIVDSTTGRDLIPSMVYGRNTRGQEFGGMYCAVLTVDSSVVSAGILRIFGQEAAELPLVATSNDYQGQGCFQTLFSCIERLLGFLEVKNLVLPAADEAEAIWTDKFGFKKMSHDQLSMYTKDCLMTIFQGTSMLQKPVPKCRIINKPIKEG